MPKKTREVCRLLGVGYWRVFELIRSGKVEPPAKDSSGDYQWFDADIRRVREALAAKGRKELRPAKSA